MKFKNIIISFVFFSTVNFIFAMEIDDTENFLQSEMSENDDIQPILKQRSAIVVQSVPQIPTVCKEGCNCLPITEAFHKNIKDRLSQEVSVQVSSIIRSVDNVTDVTAVMFETFEIDPRHHKDIDKKGAVVWLQEKTQINPEPVTSMILSKKDLAAAKKAANTVNLKNEAGKYIIPVVDVPGYKIAKNELAEQAKKLPFDITSKPSAKK